MLAAALLIPSVLNTANATLPDGVYTGTVTIHKGITLICVVTITISGGVIVDIVFGPGDFLCVLIIPKGKPYVIMQASSNSYEISGVELEAITPGGCAGDIPITWDGSNITVNTSLPPKTPGTGDCLLNGTLTKQ